MKDICAINGCSKPVDIIYYRKGICGKHWHQYADQPDKLKKILGIAVRPKIKTIPIPNFIQ